MLLGVVAAPYQTGYCKNSTEKDERDDKEIRRN